MIITLMFIIMVVITIIKLIIMKTITLIIYMIIIKPLFMNAGIVGLIYYYKRTGKAVDEIKYI